MNIIKKLLLGFLKRIVNSVGIGLEVALAGAITVSLLALASLVAHRAGWVDMVALLKELKP